MIIKDFKNYFDYSEDKTTSLYFDQYIKEEISFEDFENYILNLNENLFTDIKNKVFTLLEKISKSIKILGNKIINLASVVLKLAKKLIKSNPKLFKIIVLILILLMLSTAIAAASTNNPENSKIILEAAVGYLEKMPTDSTFTSSDVLEAKSSLLAIKQNLAHSFDDPKIKKLFSEKSLAMAKSAMKMITNAAENNDYDFVHKYWNIGKDLVLDLKTTTNQLAMTITKNKI